MPYFDLRFLLCLSWICIERSGAFMVMPASPSSPGLTSRTNPTTPQIQLASTASDSDDEMKPVNPYADPNYPDLEFINYDDPEYQVDQGTDEFGVEEEIESLREERRVRNDEYQFNTYFSKTYQKGAVFAGDWTVYKVTLGDEEVAAPRLGQAKDVLQVTSQLQMLDNQVLKHTETRTCNSAFDWESYYHTYWPQNMKQFDFRGQQGNMVCGDAWTVCEGTNAAQESTVEGPFSEYRAEIGIQYASLMRYRLKLDYQADKNQNLQLQYLTVCREVVVPEGGDPDQIQWPHDHPNYEVQEALFGIPGADGGLYDPPPISDASQDKYLLLDLPGHATALLPFLMDQSIDSGWVTSLDWTPGAMRYQVDRKVNGGKDLLGLRSLELSEVEASTAHQYRPRDGGQDMRQ